MFCLLNVGTSFACLENTNCTSAINCLEKAEEGYPYTYLIEACDTYKSPIGSHEVVFLYKERGKDSDTFKYLKKVANWDFILVVIWLLLHPCYRFGFESVCCYGVIT